MTELEIQEYLRQNLSIIVDKYDYGEAIELKVVLLLKNETISQDYIML